MVDGSVSRGVPQGWPAAVSPPGSDDLQATAAAWLNSLLPGYGAYPAMGNPVVLAFAARHVLNGAVEGTRQAYRAARAELRPPVPPPEIPATLRDLRAEGQRLSAALRSVELAGHALRTR